MIRPKDINTLGLKRFALSDSKRLRNLGLTLKYARSPQIVQKLDDLFVLIKETSEKVQVDPMFFSIILRYVKYASLPRLQENVMKKIKEFRDSREIRDIDQYLSKEDFEKGEKLGVEKSAMAIDMIKNKETDEKIVAKTGLSIEEVSRLRKLVDEHFDFPDEGC